MALPGKPATPLVRVPAFRGGRAGVRAASRRMALRGSGRTGIPRRQWLEPGGHAHTGSSYNEPGAAGIPGSGRESGGDLPPWGIFQVMGAGSVRHSAVRFAARVVLLCLLVFGVVAMHQLPVPRSAADVGSSHEMVLPSASPDVAAAPSGHAKAGDGCCGDHGHGWMLHLCLAILVAGLLLSALLLHRLGRPWPFAAGGRSYAGGRPRHPPPLPTPDVYSLRVLRL